MIGYKIFNDDLTCRGFQFKIGEANKLGNDDPLVLCENGFHFCEYPSGVWSYYDKGRVFKVEANGVLDAPETPGADLKLVCREITLLEEIFPDGDRNTGHYNTGHYNTGNRNTGNCNTGHRNTGDGNTGDYNTGNRNTGDGNTGDYNTGNRNTGNCNTGNCNTGNCNTGDGNCGDYFSGALNHGKAPYYLFNKQVKGGRGAVDIGLVRKLSRLLQSDDTIDPTPFLSLPNATPDRIKALHKAHIEARV